MTSGRTWHRGPEDERLALLGLDDLDVRVRERHDVLAAKGLTIGVLHEVVDGLVEHDTGSEMPLEDGSWRLARAEARNARPAGERADGGVERPVQAFGGQLDLELDGALGGGGRWSPSSPGEYRAGRRSGRRGAPDAARRRIGSNACPRSAAWRRAPPWRVAPRCPASAQRGRRQAPPWRDATVPGIRACTGAAQALPWHVAPRCPASALHARLTGASVATTPRSARRPAGRALDSLHGRVAKWQTRRP